MVIVVTSDSSVPQCAAEDGGQGEMEEEEGAADCVVLTGEGRVLDEHDEAW